MAYGIVKNFQDERGFITPENGEPDVLVTGAVLDQCAVLPEDFVPGTPVYYEQKSTPTGPVATYVSVGIGMARAMARVRPDVPESA